MARKHFTKADVKRILAKEAPGLAVEQAGGSLAELNRALVEDPTDPETRAAIAEIRKGLVLEFD